MTSNKLEKYHLIKRFLPRKNLWINKMEKDKKLFDQNIKLHIIEQAYANYSCMACIWAKYFVSFLETWEKKPEEYMINQLHKWLVSTPYEIGWHYS